MTTPNKPKIDRFSVLEEKQEIEAFPQSKTIVIQQSSIVCIAESRAIKDKTKTYKDMLINVEGEVVELLDNHTSGSKSLVINKLLKFAIEELLKRNISIK